MGRPKKEKVDDPLGFCEADQVKSKSMAIQEMKAKLQAMNILLKTQSYDESKAKKEKKVAPKRAPLTPAEREAKKLERKQATSVFKPHFANLPRYRGWLTSSEFGETYGRCTLCKVDVKVSNRRKGLFKHSKTMKHLMNIKQLRDEENVKLEYNDDEMSNDESSEEQNEEPILENPNDSAGWHEQMFEKAMVVVEPNVFMETSNIEVNPKIEIIDSDIEEAEECLINTQPDSTNVQSEDDFFEAIEQKPDTTQINSNDNSIQFNTNDKDKEAEVFGNLVANEMKAIADPSIRARFKEQILKVIVNLNSGKL